MNILKPAALYFAVVFGTRFVLGVIRTLFLVPQVGNRTDELIEMPFMLLAIAQVFEESCRLIKTVVSDTTFWAPWNQEIRIFRLTSSDLEEFLCPKHCSQMPTSG